MNQSNQKTSGKKGYRSNCEQLREILISIDKKQRKGNHLY